MNRLKNKEKSEVINTDKATTYGMAFTEPKVEGKCVPSTTQRQVKHLDYVVEADQGKLKQSILPARVSKR